MRTNLVGSGKATSRASLLACASSGCMCKVACASCKHFEYSKSKDGSHLEHNGKFSIVTVIDVESRESFDSEPVCPDMADVIVKKAHRAHHLAIIT